MLTFKTFLTGLEDNTDVLQESSLSRFWQHLTKEGDCIAIISACRGERDGLSSEENQALNKKNTKLLRKFVNIHGYGFVPAKGGYVEVNSSGASGASGASKEITEESTAIFAHCEDEKDEKAFKNLLIALGKKYEQECVFFVGLNKHAKWLFTSAPNFSNAPVGSEMDCGEFHATQIGQYFTKIGKKKFSFVTESREYTEYTDLSWIDYTPSERRGYDYMSKQLRLLSENNQDYFDNYFENASKSFDKFSGVIDDVLTEASMSRLWQHFQKGNPVLVISSDRGELSKSENNSNFASLRSDIRAGKFGYVKVKGGYTEATEDGKQVDISDENSCVIFGAPDTADRLLKMGMVLGVKYNQDCILWIDTKGNAQWICTANRGGSKIGQRIPLGDFHPSQIGKYYTKIGKKKFSFTSIDESTDIKSKLTTIEMQSADRFCKFLDELEMDIL